MAISGDFLLDVLQGDSSAIGECRHTDDHGIEVSEVSGPLIGWIEGEGQEKVSCLLVQGDVLTGLSAEFVQFVFEIRFDIFPAFGEAGEPEAPQIDTRKEVLAELLFTDVVCEVAIRAADEEKIALFIGGSAEWAKRFLFDSLEEHSLGLEREFADFIEEENAAIGLFEESGMVCPGSRERALLVSEEGGFGQIAAECGAVDRDIIALDFSGLFLEKIDLFGELAFAGTGWAGQEDWFCRAKRDTFDGFDEFVKGCVFGIDALLEEGKVVLSLGLESFGEFVVAGKIEVNDIADTLGIA